MNTTNFFLLLFLVSSTTFPENFKLTHPLYNPGFFSVFNTVLGALDFYERLEDCEGLVVDFEDGGLFYDEVHGLNWWSYYFEPICLGSQSKAGAEKFPTYQKIIFALNAEWNMLRDRGNELIQRYIKLRPHIQKKLDLFTEKYFENNLVIGIHYRGTDKKDEAPTVPYEEVVGRICKDIADQEKTKIFVATDDENFLRFMQENFPERVIATDAIRSVNEAVHLSTSGDIYQKGEDAILDCLLLSQCSKLYKMASNLSDTSMKFNPCVPVFHLNKSYSEDIASDKYNPFKTLNAVIALLSLYEQGILENVTVNLPVRSKKYIDQEDSNWWEHHFMPLSVGETIEPTKIPHWKLSVLGLRNLFEMLPSQAHEFIKKYIKLNPKLIDKIENFIDQKFGNDYIIGIYYDKQQYGWLQPVVKSGKMLQLIEKKIKEAPKNSKLLVITPSVKFLDKVNKKFSDVIYYNNPSNNQEQSFSEKEELDIIHCTLLSRSNTVIGTASELIKTVPQFNPKVPIEELGTLWLEKK